jgi:hypothetical protein
VHKLGVFTSVHVCHDVAVLCGSEKVIVMCGMTVILFKMPCADFSQFIYVEDAWNICH